MAFKTLQFVSGQTWIQRIQNLETFDQTDQILLAGYHSYAGGFVPASMSAGGTDTTGIATQFWLSELRIIGNQQINGLAYLIGSVGGTDKAIVALYDVNGNLLANSALAGTTVGTASTFQRIAFVTPYQASAGKYYVMVSTNGTTAHIQTQIAGNHDCGVLTAQTFGTLTTPITPPSTFTASQGPIVMTY